VKKEELITIVNPLDACMPEKAGRREFDCRKGPIEKTKPACDEDEEGRKIM
jgi:hypothetical protein